MWVGRVACVLVALVLAGGGCSAERRQRGFRLEALSAHHNDEWAATVRFADAALRAGRPTPALDAELAMLKADALGHLGHPGERALLLRYVAAVHQGTRKAADAAAALDASLWRGPDDEPSGAILPAIVVVDRPWLRHPVELFYPLEASLVGLEGSVLLALDIDPAGAVASHRVIAASDPAFARAVIGAMDAFEVDPDALRGRGSPRAKRVRLDFRLRSAMKEGTTR